MVNVGLMGMEKPLSRPWPQCFELRKIGWFTHKRSKIKMFM
jgi:hypothetical protein